MRFFGILAALLFLADGGLCSFPSVRPTAAVRASHDEPFDYVICGGGLSGCCLANRLSADGTKRVLLLEAGGSDFKQTAMRIPAGILRLFQSESDWTYFSEGEKQCKGRPVYLCRGKVLGGSSCTNVLLHMRGSSADYDSWNIEGWRGEDVLPFFVAGQDDRTGRSESAPLYHGTGGEWTMDEVRYQNELSKTFLEAAEEAGIPLNDDFNDWSRPMRGAGRFPVSEKNGERVSGATAFLEPAADRPNLVVCTGANVRRLLLGHRGAQVVCEGVEIKDSDSGSVYKIKPKAGGEVLLCGGAISSPHWLLVSGVGDPRQLEEHGIECVVPLKEVGKNLQDHPACVLSYSVQQSKRGISPTSKLRLFGSKLPNPLPLLQWLLLKTGVLTSVGCDHGAFLSTDGAEECDLQVRFLAAKALSADGMSTFTKFRQSKGHGDGFSFQCVGVRAKSTGSVSLRSADPDNRPKIDVAYLSDERDLATLREGLKLCRKMGMSKALEPYRLEEVFPGEHVQSDKQIEDYIRSTLHTANALVGTCAMGTVVDANLRVKGVDGLRVCDASVMPKITGGQTGTPVVMIASRAAHLILNKEAEIKVGNKGQEPMSPPPKAPQAPAAAPAENEVLV